MKNFTTIRTLREKLTSNKLIWVKSDSNFNGSFCPEKEDGTNVTIVFFPSLSQIKVCDGDTICNINMTEKQYRLFFKKHGYKK
jgi:hypothetical protein